MKNSARKTNPRPPTAKKRTTGKRADSITRAKDPGIITYLTGLSVLHPSKHRVPFDLYRYQRALLKSRAPERLVIKARQVGISQVIAGEALHAAKYHAGDTTLFVSRNLAAARHLQRLMHLLLREDPEMGELVAEKNRTELRLTNDSSVLSLPANEETGRTFAASRVYLDEFAHVQYADEIYQATVPCVSHGGRLMVVSTPKGKNNLFYRLYAETQLGLRNFEIHRIHWTQCPVYNPKGADLEDPEERRKLGEQGEWFRQMRPRFTEEEWAEEFECDFQSSAGLVFREFDPEVHVGDYEYNPRWPTFVGQDFGYTNPAVALVVQISPSEHVFVVDELYRTHRPISLLAREEYLPLGERYRVRTWYCDPSGAQEIAELREAGLPALGRTSDQREGILLIRKLLRPPGLPPQHSRLHIARRCRHLISELSTYAYEEGTDRPKPEADHGVDALRYCLINCFRRRPGATTVEW